MGRAVLMLAWRNVWRNRRRSLITTASMGCGLAAILFAQSMIKSLQHQLVEKATGSVTGHIQIQHRNIKDYKFPDRYIEDPDPIEQVLKSHPEVQAYERRIHITGLLSSPTGSVGVFISAVQPEKDKQITTMSGYLVQGKFLDGTPKGIVMGDKLAQRLDLRLGEKAVVMAQADDGSMGAEAFRLVGIYHTGSASFDGQIIYVPLEAAQELLGCGRKINHFVARLKDISRADRVQLELSEGLKGLALQVLSWKNVDHEIVAIQRFQNGVLDIVLMVVFLIVALGILNTLLMSLFERVREFGVLMAMGARPGWVMKLVLIEAVSLGAVGAIFGLGLGSGLIAYYGRLGLHLPIGDAMSYFIPFPTVIYLRYSWPNHLYATFAILATSILAAIPPALRAGRMRPAEALRHV